MENDWRARERERLQGFLKNDTYTGTNGELRWKSNDAVVPLDVFKDAGVKPPASQEAERDADVDRSIAAYKAAREQNGYSDEELFEMRAAFGEGEEVVDIITGHRIKL